MCISVQFEYYNPIKLLNKKHIITLSTNNIEEEVVQGTFEINKTYKQKTEKNQQCYI